VLLQEFSTEFVEGDLEYEDSSNIHAQNGELLGECGVSIAERYGLGDSSRPVAFAVWVFDKGALSSSTRILLTPFAFGNNAIQRKLEMRGELLLLQEDNLRFEIHTESMRVEVYVSDVEFSRVDSTPMGSIRRACFRMSVFLKRNA